MGYQLGVDLGTTFTAAAVVRDGRSEVVTLGTRALQVPSVVYLRDDGELLVGEPAERRSATEPGRIAREFKRRMGDPTPILLGGTPFSAHTLMSKLLRGVVDVVVAREGGAPDAVVVTRPANWGDYKKELLEQAVRQADITGATRTVSEPEAAAVFYASTTRVEPDEVVAVYDLGGGTFDATVLRKTPEDFKLLGEPMGIEQLGGVDFDEAVFAHVTSKLGDALATVDPDNPEAMAALTRLRRDCVDAKEALSSDTEATIPVALPSTRTEVRLTRTEFEDLIRPALQDTLQAMSRALRSADVEPEDIKAIVLVGGSSRIPLVSQMLVDEFHRPVAIDVHPKHAVAIGAAQLAAASVGALPEPESTTSAAAPPAPGPVPSAPRATNRRVPLLVGGAGVVAVLAIVGLMLARGGSGGGSDNSSDTTAAADGATTTGGTARAIEVPEGPTLEDDLMAFTRVEDGFWNVYLVNAAGSFTTRLTNENATRAMLPALAPNRRSIAYTVNQGNDWEIWVADSNGEREQMVVQIAPDARATWSPDGTRLAYVSDRDGPRDLYVLDLETGQQTNLTNSDEEEGDPSWSPDGDRIAYWSRAEQNQDIYVMPVEGGEATRLTTAEGDDADPEWHPNGGSLTFASQRDGDWEIYVMNDDGTGQRQLTDNPAPDQTPTFSPDGAYIAFETKRDAPDRDDLAELYIMFQDGSDPRRLTNFEGLDAHPSWGVAG